MKMEGRVFGFCLLLAALYKAPQSVEGSGFVLNMFFTSCTGGAAVLPNLSFGKIVVSGPVNFYCDGLDVLSNIPLVITWSYYATYPPTCGDHPVDECCHSTATSTLTFYTTVFTDTPLGTVVTSTGNVTAGPFIGSSVTTTATNLNSALDKCTSAMGLESKSGTATLAIVGGPSCTGVSYEEECPGVHFQ